LLVVVAAVSLTACSVQYGPVCDEGWAVGFVDHPLGLDETTDLFRIVGIGWVEVTALGSETATCQLTDAGLPLAVAPTLIPLKSNDEGGPARTKNRVRVSQIDSFRGGSGAMDSEWDHDAVRVHDGLLREQGPFLVERGAVP
jgi:hypothetical protein